MKYEVSLAFSVVLFWSNQSFHMHKQIVLKISVSLGLSRFLLVSFDRRVVSLAALAVVWKIILASMEIYVQEGHINCQLVAWCRLKRSNGDLLYSSLQNVSADGVFWPVASYIWRPLQLIVKAILKRNDASKRLHSRQWLGKENFSWHTIPS